MAKITVILSEYPYSLTQAYEKLAPILDNTNETSLGITNRTFNEFLSDPATEHIIIDHDEIRYTDTLDNCLNRNLTFLCAHFRSINTTPYSQDPGKFVLSRSNPNDLPNSEVIRYNGMTTLNISRDNLPETGIIRIWIPTPIETDSQTNVSVNISPAEWVVKKPDTHADLGMGYLEVPAEKLKGNLIINSSFTYTSHERRDAIDPDLVGEYIRSDPEYRKYTASGPTTRITPEISALARKIVGDEQNPYLQARQVYQYLNTHISSGLVPHGSVEVLNISESVYTLRKGYGDCGS